MNIFPSKFRFKFIRTSGTEEYLLKHAPEEWNDNVIKWERDKKNNVILTKYVDNFTFILEDSDFLRQCFANEKVFAKVRFTAEEYDSGNFTYKQYYSGDIDFYSYEEDRYSVKVSILEIGYKVAFDANYDTKYEIEIPGNSDTLRYDRLNLRNRLEYGCTYALGYVTENINVLDAYISSENIYANKIIRQSVTGGQKNSENWMFKVLEKCKISFHIILHIGANTNIGDTSTRYLYARIYANDRIIWTRTANNDPLNGIKIYADEEFECELNKDECVYLAICSTGGDMFCSEESFMKNSLIISYPSRGNTYTFTGISSEQLLVGLIEKATGGKYNALSANILTTGEISNMLIASGNMIRNIKDARINTSLKDFFETIRTLFGLIYTFRMIDNRETLVIQHINETFNRNSKLTTVGEINELKTSVANDYIYNRLKIGYKDQTYDEINGKFEFNTELEFATNTTAKTNELKLISPYRADAYGIEFMIIAYEQKETIDSRSDNDIFIIHAQNKVGDGSTHSLNRTCKLLNQNPEAPAGDTVFNVYLSPKNCLLRQIEYIRSLFIYSCDTLKFTSCAKEFDAISSGNIRERADIPLAGNRLFSPLVYEFETNVPYNISEKMETNNGGYIEIQDNERTLRGFILSISENPGRNKSQKWKLIAMG